MHREFDLTKADIYNDGKKHLAWKVRQQTGARMVVNLQFFNGNHTVSDMKDDGRIIFDDPWNYRGIGWNKNGDFEDTTTDEWNKYDNFISGVSLFHDGKRQNLTKVNGQKIYTSDVGRSSGNTAVGKLKDGRAFVLCEKEGDANKTPEEVQDYLIKLYRENLLFALLVDGGGSSQLSIAGDEYVYSSRPVLTLLCLWYDVSDTERLIDIAYNEIGHAEPYGDDKYIKWYNEATGAHLPLNVAWCACFVSYCMSKVYKDFTPFCSCTAGMNHFESSGQLHSTPKVGDLIFFNWDSNKNNAEHVGIVYKVANNHVYTIEGNSGDAVKKRSYAINNRHIIKYGRMGKPEKPWYADSQKRLMGKGITDGTNPMIMMTRAQAWVMLDRAMQNLKGDKQ